MAQKEQISQHEQAFAADPKGLFAMLQKQFSDPLLAFRELVQNAADESPSKITITTKYGRADERDCDNDDRQMHVSIEDDGNGMDLSGIKRYLTLFDSTKENDPTKVGQLGVGKLSLFVLRPSQVIVETGKNGEGYTLELDSQGGGKLYRTAPRKGTKISATIPDWNFRSYSIAETIRDTCRYITVPTTVNGRAINDPFTIHGRYQTKIEEPDLEALIALSHVSQSKRASREYFRGRILLEQERPDEPDSIVNQRYRHVSLLVNSPHFEPTISRNRAVRNRVFFDVGKRIQTALDHFFETLAADYLAGRTNSSDSEFLRTCLLEHITSLRGTTATKPFSKLPFFESTNLRDITLEQIQESYKQERKLYVSTQRHSKTDLAPYTERNIPVFSMSETERDRTPIQQFLAWHYGPREDISVSILVDPISYRALTPEQQSYIRTINTLFASGLFPLPIFAPTEYGRTITLKQAALGKLNTAYGQVNDRLFAPKSSKLILNLNNPFITETIETSRRHPETAALYLIGEILGDDTYYKKVDSKDREDALLRVAEKLVRSHGRVQQ